MSEVRKEIVWFSKEMEAKLKKYDSKGGWEDLTTVHLLGRIKDELKELEDHGHKWKDFRMVDPFGFYIRFTELIDWGQE